MDSVPENNRYKGYTVIVRDGQWVALNAKGKVRFKNPDKVNVLQAIDGERGKVNGKGQ